MGQGSDRTSTYQSKQTEHMHVGDKVFSFFFCYMRYYPFGVVRRVLQMFLLELIGFRRVDAFA